ncbi:hypothetical protein [Paracoccus sp. MKU1]|uniref:hypothetical protein n=1 Tax=Paracoccus sp. MKU1 TaxID=1745182 RepID=UPI00071944AD|nr:hypothetical protein [Paracoccus sp. MKU1]KRW95027.1 hypothetical protein AQY21_17355 [Paracoccus sp. MKU1]
MRSLRQACLPASLALLSLAALGVAAMALLPLPRPVGLAIGGTVALLPLLLVFFWLIHIPDIWNVPPSWVAVTTLLISLPLVLFGQYFAAQTLSEIFRDAPALFPIASAVAGYLGVLLGALALIGYAGLAFLTVLVSWALLTGFIGWIGGRRFLRDVAAYAVAALLIGWTVGSVAHLERLARNLVTHIAVEADFHSDHRCSTAGWPEGVTRVAFIGDEQVLGYILPDRRIVALSCRRAGVIGHSG